MKAPCDRCRNSRVLTEYTPNQKATLRLCAACIAKDKEVRSKAATGKAGRPPKSDSQIEDQLYKFALNSVDGRTLDLWLTTEGYTGTRGQQMKQWALATVERARRKSG